MSERTERVESLLCQLVAAYVVAEANPNPLITITKVSISPDLRNATVFLTTIPEDREQDAVIFMKRSATDLRNHIKKRTNLKFIPNFVFEIDSGERARQYIDELARKIAG
ncbi:hypothetical protein A2392_02875 [Candidatus Kaiserbacteria bacterium RIFOXYB1_FULL_46_14]|uniref:Ribosome-binding factor A n=1 Tax=Candidatus Kaiserbacteria bacterium RIFOXYB1_FULL_46_14 TaxID=1798531 RepID=A0A1F6FIM5_9BACT|nr:MAG: hypothetical protein A2392_02875 [Candidatus Kaiserbacteria bacterium RIFOXYB1_FULL_46_14]